MHHSQESFLDRLDPILGLYCFGARHNFDWKSRRKELVRRNQLCHLLPTIHCVVGDNKRPRFSLFRPFSLQPQRNNPFRDWFLWIPRQCNQHVCALCHNSDDHFWPINRHSCKLVSGYDRREKGSLVEKCA